MLLLACVVLVVVAAVAVGRMGQRLVHRNQAHVAADAAALAGTHSGVGGAVRLAQSNGARLVSFSVIGDDVVVTVEVHGERAAARATTGP